MTTTATLALDAIQACVDASEGRAVEALQRLEDRYDPESLQARLTILLDLDRNEEAFTLIQGRPLDPKWCVKALFATLRVRDADEGTKLLEVIERDFSHDGLLRLRCRLGAAESAYQRAFPSPMRGQTILPPALTTRQRVWLDAAAGYLAPVIDRVCSFGSIEHAVELHAMELALIFAFLRADGVTSDRIGPVLEQIRPLPMALIDAVLRRQCTTPPDCVQRIRTEHETSWVAKMAAIRIEGYILEHPDRAVISALSLIRSAPAEYQEEFGKMLFDLSAALPEDTCADVERLLLDILPAQSLIPVAIRLRQALRADNIIEAERLLNEMPDRNDPIALQFQAQVLLRRGKKHEARLAVDAASEHFLTPSLLELSAKLAGDEGDWRGAAEALGRALQILPADVNLRRNRAYALIHSDQFSDAAKEFGELIRLEPTDAENRFNRAAAFAQGGHLDESLAVFREYCEAADFPLKGILAQSEILVSIGRAPEAFAVMQGHASSFWDNRQFLACYMSCAYSAGQDGEGHKAMIHLQELEQTIQPDERILKAVSLDDLKDHFAHFRKSDEMLHEQLLLGRIPWLFADRLLNRVPYEAWSFRTQPLIWESDDHIGAARHTIYATNMFHTVDREGEKELQQLDCSRKGTAVCIDMSALITLNELDMLGRAAEYFEKIIVPAQCFESTILHLRRLIPHQPSRRHAAIAIRTAIESGRISTPEPPFEGTTTEMPLLSEIDTTNPRAYHFADLAAALHDAGAIGTDDHAALKRVAHLPSSVRAAQQPLAIGQELLCDVSTLEILHQAGLLPVCLESFDMYLTAEDRKEVFSTVQAYEAQASLHEKAKQFLEIVRGDTRFVVEHVSLPPELIDKAFFSDPLAASTFASAFAAVDRRLPLFSDDRSLQMYALHRGTTDGCAFSTAALLEALADSDGCDIRGLGSALLSLLNWRYRFIVPSPKFLKHYADQFPAHVPGRYLRQVAMYAHQSLSDPGLFCGFEPTVPPTSIASRLLFRWIKAFMDLAAQCWLDTDYTEERATAMMDWILTEAIPPVPRMFDPAVQAVLATQVASSVFNYFALATATSADSARIALAMKSLRNGLALSDASYLKLVTQLAYE
jgi:tetratricopeptide (TPR) repeat protein